jgi:hypothetical protein
MIARHELMSSDNELISCPGGCGNAVHRHASACPYCGYQAELGRVEELLGSLSTVSSILTGFGLAALVQLATGESRPKDDALLQWTTGLWLVSSLLLLGVMLSSEVLRRREIGGSRLQLSVAEDERIWHQGELLLGCFALALLGMAVGVVLLGFSFSLLLGIVGCVAVIFVFVLLWRMW